MSDDPRFDVRTQRHNLERKLYTNDELKKHLAGLPDDAEEGEATETEFVIQHGSGATDSK